MIGSTVGRFRIVAKLGEGGMGSVWKGEDTLLGRSIALKFLPESLATQTDARRRFLREARAASALHHPGIATVFDAGEADGRVYIAMYLVDGRTLSDVVSRGPLPVADAVRIVQEAALALALAYAHDHGVLHRDVSSRNIMLDSEARVVVQDLGLALPEGAPRGEHTARQGHLPLVPHKPDRAGLGVVRGARVLATSRSQSIRRAQRTALRRFRGRCQYVLVRMKRVPPLIFLLKLMVLRIFSVAPSLELAGKSPSAQSTARTPFGPVER